LTLSTTQFFFGALHPTNPNFLLGGTKDNGCAIWTGSSLWSEAPIHADPGCEGEVAMSTSHPETDWMTAAGPNISRVTNGGNTIALVQNGIDWTNLANGFVPVRQCPANENVFLTGSGVLWRTDNFFSSATPAWSANSPAGTSITAIAFAPS